MLNKNIEFGKEEVFLKYIQNLKLDNIIDKMYKREVNSILDIKIITSLSRRA